MSAVVVPIRYPLSPQSTATLETARAKAETRDTVLSVTHVARSATGQRIPRDTLKHAVETAIGPLPDARYVSRSGMLVEEMAAQEVDIVVIGAQQGGRWRQLLRRLLGQIRTRRFADDDSTS
jgi:nucleotide-binding universal stress UspA family protein